MFDSHTHLNSDQLYPNRKNHLYSFIDAGGTHLVNIGIDTPYNTKALTIAQERIADTRSHECIVKATIGIHPCSVGDDMHADHEKIDIQLATIRSQIDDHTNHIVGVGECGIDAHHGEYETNKHLQRHTLEQQCALAQKLDLPVIIHSRSQRPDTLSILKQFKYMKIYLHCWSYTSVEIQEASSILSNLWIGFCGNTTYPKAQELRKSLKTARGLQNEGSCKVVIETDAPYLAPQTHRGSMNTPAYLTESGILFAETLGISKDQLFQTTKENSCLLYSL